MAVGDNGFIYSTFTSSDINTFFVVRSTDNGSTWDQYPLSGNELSRGPRDIVVDHMSNVWLLWISRDDEFAPAYLNLSKSIDSGKVFNTVFRSLSYANGFLFQKLAVDADNTIYMLWDDVEFKLTRFVHGDISKRIDAGVPADTLTIANNTALVVTKDLVVHCVWEGLFFDTANHLHEYVYYSRSNDTGKTFERKVRVDTTTNAQIYNDANHIPSLAVDSAGLVFVSYTKELQVNNSEIRIARSSNGGQSFDAPMSISGSDTAYRSALCLDSQNGVNILWSARGHPVRYFRSTDNGTTFTQFSSPNLGFLDLVPTFNGSLLATGTTYSGISFTRTDITLSVAGSQSVPTRFNLFSNFPNPFNPATTIRYEIPVRSLVQMRIFDLLGREVSLLVNEYKDIGSYEVRWDANKLPSGTYFYRVQAGKFSDVKKMLLVK